MGNRLLEIVGAAATSFVLGVIVASIFFPGDIFLAIASGATSALHGANFAWLGMK